MSNTSVRRSNGGANLGFEAVLWSTADQLRGHMDAAEYKHVVLAALEELKKTLLHRAFAGEL